MVVAPNPSSSNCVHRLPTDVFAISGQCIGRSMTGSSWTRSRKVCILDGSFGIRTESSPRSSGLWMCGSWTGTGATIAWGLRSASIASEALSLVGVASWSRSCRKRRS
ncbi:hypothetical protein KC19_7G017800 [Ceratodon purpureus]|uniref:Uncharacterized protein n=1 Tax=Ceratodon purpureus TaxID=3225 RepID=A0A8T0H3R6_CERPU|nr:hypothetical protein KC19_7G017800 [Ceratodon purpureus]